MATDCLFREDSYLKECSATVVGVTQAGGVVLDRTVFYAASGGQPADRGVLRRTTGEPIPIAGASYTDADKSEISHQPTSTDLALKEGETGMPPSIGICAMPACACTPRCTYFRRCCPTL
jgi:misacylated tRNA(Ala) deacylase